MQDILEVDIGGWRGLQHFPCGGALKFDCGVCAPYLLGLRVVSLIDYIELARVQIRATEILK